MINLSYENQKKIVEQKKLDIDIDSVWGTLHNRDIVAESIEFNESICSKNDLKYGLSEGSIFYFQAKISYNLEGEEITVNIRIPNVIEPVKLGKFIVVKQTEVDHDFGIYEITAYQKISFVDWNTPYLDIIKKSFSHFSDDVYKVPAYNILAEAGLVEPGQMVSVSSVGTKSNDITITSDDQEYQYRATITAAEFNPYSVAGKHTLYKVEKQDLSEKERVLDNMIRNLIMDIDLSMLKDYLYAIVGYGQFDFGFGSYSFATKGTVYIYPKLSADNQTSYRLYVPIRITGSLYQKSYDGTYKKNSNFDVDISISARNVSVGAYESEVILYKSAEDINIKSIFESYLELQGKFYKENREGNISTFEIRKTNGLYPAKNLYPSRNLYPSGPGFFVRKSMYKYISSVVDLRKKYIYMKKTSESNTSVDYLMSVSTKDFVSYNDSYKADVYDLTNNEILKRAELNQDQIEQYMRTIAYHVEQIPVKVSFEGIGLPFLEAGDEISIESDQGSIQSIILSQTIKGLPFLEVTIN